MNITVTDQENCKKQLHIEIPGEDVRAETDKVASQLARSVNVPGFRPGHAPKSVIKTRFRKELRDEVVSHLLPESLQKAVTDKELKVIGEPAAQVWVVPQEDYSPIKQNAVLLKHGAENQAAKDFIDYLKSDDAVALIKAAGYTLE